MTADRDLFGDLTVRTNAVRLGRRVFLPSALRAKIVELRAADASLEVVAGAVGISVATLRARFAAELERGLPGGRRAGRPQWRPTPDERARIAQLAADGVKLEGIVEAVGVTAPTLRRHCAAELAAGRAARRRPAR